MTFKSIEQTAGNLGNQRKHWSPEFKEQLVLAVLQGDQTVDLLVHEYGVAERLIHNWRTQFLEPGRACLVSKQQNLTVKALERENKRLMNLLGRKWPSISRKSPGSLSAQQAPDLYNELLEDQSNLTLSRFSHNVGLPQN